MPVTARLSRLFYERFGEQVTNELVDWFNQVDATYRNELRELNEANFARFDAKLEQRIAELRADFTVSLAKLEGQLERGFRAQTAWFFVAWAIMFATLVALELRR
jgi:hypothetical protein